MIYLFLSLRKDGCPRFENQSFADIRSVIQERTQPEVCGFECGKCQSQHISVSEANVGIPSGDGEEARCKMCL